MKCRPNIPKINEKQRSGIAHLDYNSNCAHPLLPSDQIGQFLKVFWYIFIQK